MRLLKDEGIGIESYGAYLPHYRLPVEEVIDVWGNSNSGFLRENLGLSERTVLSPDEDTTTLAVSAARNALAGCSASEIGALFVGTGTPVFATRPTSTILLDALGVPASAITCDLQFAEKSGTAAFIVGLGVVGSGLASRALCVAVDTLGPHVSPCDFKEYSASSGAAAIVVGGHAPLAVFEAVASHSCDLSDAFRISGERYLQSGGDSAQKGGIGLDQHVTRAVEELMQGMDIGPDTFDYAVFPQPDGVTALRIAESLGFKPPQVATGNVATRIGDCGAATVFLGLAATLDRAVPGERILLASYGAGAGCDAIALRVTDEIDRWAPPQRTEALLPGATVNYATAAKFEGKYDTKTVQGSFS